MPAKFMTMLYRLRSQVIRAVLKPSAQPRPLTFVGAGSALQLCAAISALGLKKILIVTDKPLVDLGLLSSTEQALLTQGIEVVIFDGVLPDPTFQIIDSGLVMAQQNQCDSVLAFGGGSSIDSAKTIALAASNNLSPAALVGAFKAKLPSLPLFVIPTTAGTGSEATIAAVVSDNETHAKQMIADNKLICTGCALDPALMTGLPPHITAATGMDALTHAVESYIGTWGTPDTRRLGRAAVNLIFEHLPTACHSGDQLPAREAMALASYYAGIAFSQAMVGFVHAISHQLGAKYGIPHGLANAVVLPHVLEFSREAAEVKMAELALHAELGQTGESNESLSGKFIDKVRALNAEVGIPIGFEQIRAEDIPVIAAAACKEGNGYPVPRYMDIRECTQLLEGLRQS
ncbi:MAG: iron-containing alcohol dehydrogenase [Halieaceae bacterium]|jgi:alcohol dehydrogenase|nr:iron-containing alcohol dehydrogenase [Halieaceae bacterium]